MRDEHYIIGLCDAVLGIPASRQHKFDFLLGDKCPRGRQRKLPVDAYYETLRLVIEYRELQHTEAVPIMDRRITISGCSRGEQRRRYDEGRRTTLPMHNIALVELCYSQFAHDRKKKLRRDPVADAQAIRAVLARFIR
jgi:hypothetical protein